MTDATQPPRHAELSLPEGRVLLDVVSPEGTSQVARLRISFIPVDGAPAQQVELPSVSTGQVLFKALTLLGSPVVPAEPEPGPGAPARGAVQRELDKSAEYLPRDLTHQPTMPDQLAYWAPIGLHRMMTVRFLGPWLHTDVPPPAVIPNAVLRAEPWSRVHDGPPDLYRFVLADGRNPHLPLLEVLSDELRVELTGLT